MGEKMIGEGSLKGFLATRSLLLLTLILLLFVGISHTGTALAQDAENVQSDERATSIAEEQQSDDSADESELVRDDTVRTAIFAGGCFWCMEPPFDALDGVKETTVGYTGGTTPDPTYAEVSGKSTGHYEAIRIVYDPQKITYQQLLDIYWRNIDPIDDKGQFCDRGSPYLSAIFVETPEERALAEKSKQKVQKDLEDKGKIATKVLPRGKFYEAEEYHQDYYIKNKLRYKYYRKACKRDSRLEELWGLIFS
jgi:peptide-methionine (S)-S-oxide reductase